LNISAALAVSRLLVLLTASATGIIPVFDLDFTRSATKNAAKTGHQQRLYSRRLKSRCVYFCREGSSMLWKYQALDLEQHAAIQIG